jgi:hypothetical protein
MTITIHIARPKKYKISVSKDSFAHFEVYCGEYVPFNHLRGTHRWVTAEDVEGATPYDHMKLCEECLKYPLYLLAEVP